MPEASRAAVARLTKEYIQLQKSPIEYVKAKPSESDILKWHYLIDGPPNTNFAGGLYHGMLVFPHDYPFNPPSIKMITPNGRFIPNTGICLNISDFHKETWNPAWSVGSVVVGLLSFMTGNESSVGSVYPISAKEQTRLRDNSKNWNVQANCDFKKEFPHEYSLLKSALEKNDKQALSRLLTKDYFDDAEDEREKQIVDQNGKVMETVIISSNPSMETTPVIDVEGDDFWMVDSGDDEEEEIIEFSDDEVEEIDEEEVKMSRGIEKENPILVD